MDEEIRLSGADHPHVQIPRLGELDAVWARRIVLAVVASLVVGLLGGIAAALLLGERGLLSPVQWGLVVGGAALLVSGIILSLTRADDAPRNDLMDARARASKGLRTSVRRTAVPQDPALREMQDYMAVEMVQYAWPILLTVPGMAHSPRTKESTVSVGSELPASARLVRGAGRAWMTHATLS